jgi:hypothetical protein
MRKFLTAACVALLAALSGCELQPAFAQGVTRVCVQAVNPVTGANNCVDASTTNPFPIASVNPSASVDNAVLNGPLTCSASCANTTLLGPIDTTGYGSIHFQVTSPGTGVQLQAQSSDDPGLCSAAVNWNSFTADTDAYAVGNSSSINSINNVIFSFVGGLSAPVKGRCFRLQITAYGSGTITAEGYLRVTRAENSAVFGTVGAMITPNNQPSAATTITNATSTALETARPAKASAGNLYGFYCTAITGAAAGFCIAYNANATPGTGALTGSLVLDSCAFDTTNKGCSLSRLPGPPRNYSAGIVVLCSSAVTPFTYTTGVDTCYISVDYQ